MQEKLENFVSRKCTKLQKLFQWKFLTWYQWHCVIFVPTNPENLKWEFILFNHTMIMSQNFGKFANFAPDITQPIWSSKIIFVFFNPEFVGCVVKTLIIQNQINICINICDLNIWTLLRYEKIKIYKKYIHYILRFMPCPFTGPKNFWARPIFLCQTKNLFTYCGSHKHFVTDKKMICVH